MFIIIIIIIIKLLLLLSLLLLLLTLSKKCHLHQDTEKNYHELALDFAKAVVHLYVQCGW